MTHVHKTKYVFQAQYKNLIIQNRFTFDFCLFQSPVQVALLTLELFLYKDNYENKIRSDVQFIA